MGYANALSAPLLMNVYGVTGTVSLSIANATWDLSAGFYVQAATANTAVNPSQIAVSQGTITVNIGATVQSLVLVCSAVIASVPLQITITPTFSEYDFLGTSVAVTGLVAGASSTPAVTKSGAPIFVSISD
jgi:hypothetical protein